MSKKNDFVYLCLYTNNCKNQIKSCTTGTKPEINWILRKILKRYPSSERKHVHWRIV